MTPQPIAFTTYGPGFNSPSAIGTWQHLYPLHAHCNPAVTSHCTPYTNYTGVINIGLSWSAESASLPTAGIPQMLQFLTDYVNYRGGITMLNGSQYYVSVTLVDDQGSDAYMSLIYETYINSQQFPLLIAPLSDSLLVALEPLIANQSITLLSLANYDQIGRAHV